ncbi:MAG TPA: CotH kinase family protein [Flavobacteriales bacterium]
MRSVLPFLAILCPLLLAAQDLPSEFHYSDDGHRLKIGGAPSTGFYQKDLIRTIDLNFPQSNYWTLLTQNYASETNLLASMTCEGTTYDSIGVRFKGNTSYMMLPSGSEKKSFNVTLDHVIDGQNIMGYETLNLNNAFEDASFLREVLYLELIRDHIPAAKANFVHLNINGASWGLYPNVQQLNSQYSKEWFFSNNGTMWRADRPDGQSGGGPGGGGPSWGDGTAALNYLGSDTASYQTYYTLKRTEQVQPWDALVTVCDKLNNGTSATLEDSLPKYLDVDRTLWFLASEIAFGDDDSYVYKGKMDYYLYWDEETRRMTPLEFDGNSCMKTNTTNWGPFYHANDADYPLLARMLSVPAWRQRYLAHLRTIIAEKLQSTTFNALVAEYDALIDAEVLADPKKLYTYNAFNNELTVLQNWITSRRNYLNSNTEVAQTAPVIASVEHRVDGTAWAAPQPNAGVDVVASVTSTTGISAVNLYYSNSLYGNFTAMPMYDDGAHNDGAAGDGLYGAALPGGAAMSWIRYYVEAVAANAALSASYSPVGAEHDVYIYQVAFNSVTEPAVRINELMAQNTSTVTDPQGQYEDWIELFNTTSASVDLSGYGLSDDGTDPFKWTIPSGINIGANGYLVLWADEDIDDGWSHADFKLSASGEELWLTNPAGEVVDQVIFGPQQADLGYARIPNGSGPFVIQAPTFSANNEQSTALAESTGTEIPVIFPNPASTQLMIRTRTAQDIRIMDATGRTVWAAQVNGTETIDPGMWSNGTYFVRHASGTSKLVVMH